MEIALWSPGRGGRLKSAHQSSTPEGSCSVLGTQRYNVGRARFLERIRVLPLTGGYCHAGPSPGVMARLCCPGREGGRQVAVLLKATRTAFERGTRPCRASICEQRAQMPPRNADGTLFCVCALSGFIWSREAFPLPVMAPGGKCQSRCLRWLRAFSALGMCRSPRRGGRSRGGPGGPAARHGAVPAAGGRPRHPPGQPQLSGPLGCALTCHRNQLLGV